VEENLRNTVTRPVDGMNVKSVGRLSNLGILNPHPFDEWAILYIRVIARAIAILAIFAM